MKWQTGSNVSNQSQYLDEPGTYHLAITAVDEEVLSRDQQLVDNAAFRIHTECCAGTAAGQEGRKKEITFFHPRPNQKNDGEFARKKIDRLFLATNLLKLEQLGGELDIDLQQMVGQQFVAKFVREKPDDKYIDLSFCDIYHVDDPAVKDIPKSAAMLKLIPKKWRWPAGKAATNGQAAPLPAVDPESLNI